MSDWNSGPTLTLGPISAAQGSPLGGFLAWAQGVSSNFAAGNAVATANPGLAVQAATGSVPNADLISAYQQGMYQMQTYTPFQQFGTTVGNIFGTGVGVIGSTVGIAGGQAAPGVAGGTSQAASGVATVAGAGAVGTISGSLKGALQGIGVGLNSGAAGGATGGQDQTLLYLAGGLVILALFLTLT